ncbi:MAG: hypothetical protein ABR567_02415 [Myxococcales bacterium]
MFTVYIRTAYEFWLGHKAPFELLGLALGFCSILFAVYSIRDGRKLTNELRSVFDHLTTKEIGAFPVYMAEIERMIAEARESIFIATDFPGHGVFTDRGHYGTYVKALENRKAERVRKGHALSVQVLSLDAENRARAMRDRFPEARWKEVTRKGMFPRSRRLYEELENCELPDNREEFLAEMELRQVRALDSELRFADRWQYSGVMPIYLWIIDGERAVFAIPSSGEHLTEYGFYTEETGLVQALLSVWARYVEHAHPLAGQPMAVVKAS